MPWLMLSKVIFRVRCEMRLSCMFRQPLLSSSSSLLARHIGLTLVNQHLPGGIDAFRAFAIVVLPRLQSRDKGIGKY